MSTFHKVVVLQLVATFKKEKAHFFEMRVIAHLLIAVLGVHDAKTQILEDLPLDLQDLV